VCLVKLAGDVPDGDGDARVQSVVKRITMLMMNCEPWKGKGKAHTNSQVGCLNRVCETKSKREEKILKDGGGRRSFKGLVVGEGERARGRRYVPWRGDWAE
jgi:hypothetical protein